MVCMHIGEKIRLLRKANLLNQKSYSDQLGISQGTLSDIESGKSNPSTETLLSLKRVFECDLNWLLGSEKSTDFSDNTIFNIRVSKHESDILGMLRKLDPDNKYEIEQLLRIKTNNLMEPR